MATTTTFLGLRKPTNIGGVSNKGDPIDVVADIANNMDLLDAFAALVSAKFGSTVEFLQDTLGSVTATTYTETFTGGAPAQGTFTAPQSGKIVVHNTGFVDNTGTPRSLLSYIIRTGGVIGSGSTQFDANDPDALSNVNVDDISCTRTKLVTGLTPGATYNIRQQGKISSAGPTGQFQYMRLLIQPTY